MALLGTLDPFTSTDAEDWTTYLARLDQFYKANKIEDGRKKSVFLTIIGDTTFRLLQNMVAPSKLEDKTLAELRTTLTDHFSPKRLVIAERYRFWNRVQHVGESYQDYAAELRRLARFCEFAASLEDSIRDRFVCGIRDTAVCKKLLTIDALALDVALKTAVAHETVDREAASLAGGAVQLISDKYQAKKRGETSAQQQRGEPKSDNSMACYRCGGKDHVAPDCRFKNAECRNCKKKGHLARVCRSRAPNSAATGTNLVRADRLVNHASGSSELVEASISVQAIDDDLTAETTQSQVLQIQPSVTVRVRVNGVPATFEVDTGASVSLMSLTTWKQSQSQPLQNTPLKLSTYTGASIAVAGMAVVDVEHANHKSKLPLYIVEGDGPTLLGRNWLREVKLDWTNIFRVEPAVPELDKIISENSVLFDGDPGCLQTATAHLTLKDGANSVFRRPRSLPFAIKPAVEAELQRMESQGIIEPVPHSDWATPVVPVPKPDGSVRLCGDYRVTVNPQLNVDQHPLPTPKEIFSSLNRCQYFAKLDLAQAYLQVPLDEVSQAITTISTHKGLFKFKRLPYGIASAPAVFQGIMDKLLAGLEGVSKYLDDILIAAETRELLLQRLAQVLRILRDAGVRLKKSKCTFLTDSVEYLGFRIDASGLHATAEKVKAVQDAPAPKAATEVRAFMGLVNYYGQFIENLATVAQPLYQLMKQEQQWKWTEVEQVAFDKLKKMLSSTPVLVHYDPQLPVTLACDASGVGVGAVLSHVMPDGKEQPVAFASRSLSSAERNYSQLEREALGIIVGVTKFHQYLYGRKFTLVTDNRPLAVILGPKRGIPSIAAMRLQRWAVTLAAYRYDVKVKSSEANANADCMSRLPLPETADIDGEISSILAVHQDQLPILHADIRAATATDITLSKVLSSVQNGWPTTVAPELEPYRRIAEELTVEQGCLQRGVRTVIPTCLQTRLLGELHIAHPGITRMKALARTHIWWPGLDKAVEDMVRRCNTCQLHRNVDAPVSVNRWPQPEEPWSRIHADFAGPVENKMYLVVTDAYSKWLEVVAMHSTSSRATITEMERLFAAYGLPHAMVTDNGPQFTSQEWTDFTTSNGIVHMRSAPYFPATNGAAERAVQSFKAALARERADGVPWDKALRTFLERYRATPHTVTGKAPALMFLQRDIRTRLHLLKPAPTRQTETNTSPPAKQFMPGDAVYAKMFNCSEKWMEGTIMERAGLKSYQVRLRNGAVTRRHVDQLRHREAPGNTDSSAEVTMQSARSRSTRQRQPPARYKD